MLETQKQLDRLSNAYTTKESYLATIVHEFGHIYFDSFGLQFFPDPKDSQLYINKALEMFEGNDTLKIENVEIRLPLDHTLSEVFAFCTDYSAASIFWPQHKQDIDRMQAADIKRYVGKKSKDDLQNNDTYLPKDPHLMAAIVGKILLNKYPETWPIKLIQFSTLPLSN